MLVDRCLSLFFWLLCSMSFVNIRILITPLVPSSVSYDMRVWLRQREPKPFNWLLAKMVEYVGKRLLLLGLFIYIRCYTFPGTVKCFRSRCQFVVCPFVLVLLTIVLYVLRQFTNSDYPFGTFKRVLWHDGVNETTRAKTFDCTMESITSDINKES
jgi:hypothetical protein